MSSQTQIDLLKKVKVPLWARWRGYFAARKRRKEAAEEIKYIATVYAWTRYDKYSSRQWYILRENGLGKRTYEYGYESSFLKDAAKTHAEYPNSIVPWVHGKYSNAQMIEYAKKSAIHPNERVK